MSEHDVLKKNRNFYIGVGGTVLEGLLSGSLFMLLYSVMQFLWSGQFDMKRALILTGVIAVIFLLRILIYSYGYTKAQIGGAEVSKNIRLFMGDHLKRIPLSRFTQGQTGDYMVRSVDVARHMEVSKPSVCHAVATLRDGGFLTMDEDHFLHLTDVGREVAEKIYERHCFFTEQLIAAGVDPKTAEADACRIEHIISDESFSRLKEAAAQEQE